MASEESKKKEEEEKKAKATDSLDALLSFFAMTDVLTHAHLILIIGRRATGKSILAQKISYIRQKGLFTRPVLHFNDAATTKLKDDYKEVQQALKKGWCMVMEVGEKTVLPTLLIEQADLIAVHSDEYYCFRKSDKRSIETKMWHHLC